MSLNNWLNSLRYAHTKSCLHRRRKLGHARRHLRSPVASEILEDRAMLSAASGVTNGDPIAVDDSGFFWVDPDTGEELWRDYLVLEGDTLVVSASDGVLKNDFDPDPIDNDSLTAFLATSTSYGTVSLNSDGSFSYTPNGSAFDDPSSDLTDSFTYYLMDPGGAYSNEAVVSLFLDTFVIDVTFPDGTVKTYADGADGTGEELWAGQKVKATVKSKAGKAEITTNQWTISGTAIDNYEAGNFFALVTNIPAAELRSKVVDFYWVSGGNQTVEATVNGNKSVEVQLGPKRPSVTMTASTSSVTPIIGEQRVGASFKLGETPGIKFQAQTLDYDEGEFAFVQTIRQLYAIGQTADGTITEKFEYLNALDNTFPYGIQENPMPSVFETEDSPQITFAKTFQNLHLQNGSVDFEFSMAFMFKPAGMDSIWVPIKQADWDLSWEINKVGDTYQLENTSFTQNPAVLESHSYADLQWDNRATNSGPLIFQSTHDAQAAIPVFVSFAAQPFTVFSFGGTSKQIGEPNLVQLRTDYRKIIAIVDQFMTPQFTGSYDRLEPSLKLGLDVDVVSDEPLGPFSERLIDAYFEAVGDHVLAPALVFEL